MPIIDKFTNKRHNYAYMKDVSFKSLKELHAQLGKQIQQLRISRNLDQSTTAAKAGISERALRYLEAGHGSSTETLLRVLKALDSLDGLQLIAPKPSISPLALLKHKKVRQRVRRTRQDRAAETGRDIEGLGLEERGIEGR
jgi:transcriptional regulator with XRE-family HTH domain